MKAQRSTTRISRFKFAGIWYGTLSFLKLLCLRPEYCFLFLATIFGLFIAFILPPMRVQDEASHFYRAYQVSEGHIFSTNYHGKTGGFMPKQVVYVGSADIMSIGNHTYRPGILVHQLKQKIVTGQRTFVAFNNTAVYSPLSYVPQTLAILICKLFYPSALLMMYVGRLLNLAVYVALVYLAIRFMPFGKWALAVIALLPMAIHQAGSLSSDVLVISLAFVSIALFFHLLYSKNHALTPKRWAGILVLALFMGLTKQTDAVLMLPFFFLPKQFFSTLKVRLAYYGSLALCALGGALIWYVAVKVHHYDMDLAYIPGHKPDQALQTSLIIHHPLYYARVLFHTLIYNNIMGYFSPDAFWQQMVGTFSWYAYNLPLPNTILAYAGLAVAMFMEPSKVILQRLTMGLRALFGFTWIAFVLATVTVLYFVCSLVASPIITGIQGRYFIPALTLLIPVFANKHVRVSFSKEWLQGAVLGGISLVNLLVLAILTFRFFY